MMKRRGFSIWDIVAFIWCLNIFFMVGVSPFIEGNRLLIVISNVTAGAATVSALLSNARLTFANKEAFLFLLLIVWVLFGAALAEVNHEQSERWTSVLLKSWFVVLLLPEAIRQSGKGHWFLFAFFLATLCSSILWLSGRGMAVSTSLELLNSADRGKLPNFFGGMASFGVICFLGLYPWWKRRWFVASVAGCLILVLLFTVVASASRMAMAYLVLFIPAWGLFCLPTGKNGWRNRFFFTICLVLVVYFSASIILEETYLGTRMNRIANGKDQSFDARLGLILVGMDLFIHNPIVGVGLGNYRFHSPGGLEAHSELIELLASTGIVGAGLYYCIYWFLIRRIWWLQGDPEGNVFLARFVICASVSLVLVSSVTSSSFLSPERVMLLSMFVGLSHSLMDRNRALWSIDMVVGDRSSRLPTVFIESKGR